MLLIASLLCSALYLKNSKYGDSDAVFGVKSSLVVEIQDMDEETAVKYNRANLKKVLKWNFVLASDAEANTLREQYAKQYRKGA